MSSLTVRVERKVYLGPGRGAPRVALEGLRLDVPEGQFACIVGPSGCGKTTLLNIISGVDTDVEGPGLVDGADSAEAPAIGYVFQEPRLMPWLTVLDNVRLVLDGPAARDGRAEALVREVGMGDAMDAYPGSLSTGMRRRAALARAFAVEPRILLMDEPFVSLDAPVAERLRRLLLDIWSRRPTTVLFVTHDLREAIWLGDRLLFMSASPGRIVYDMAVDLPRPRPPEGAEVEAIRRRILETHPDLLAGLLGGTGEETEREGSQASDGETDPGI